MISSLKTAFDTFECLFRKPFNDFPFEINKNFDTNQSIAKTYNRNLNL